MPKKEFKPVQHEKMDDSQKETLKFIDHQWTTHPFIENFHGKWEEYIAWWEGDQYTYWNSFASKLVDVRQLITELDPGRESKNVYNRITPLVRQIWGDIKYPYEFRVIPNTAEPEDVKAALELGTKGVLIASAVMKAEDTGAVIREIAEKLSI